MEGNNIPQKATFLKKEIKKSKNQKIKLTCGEIG